MSHSKRQKNEDENSNDLTNIDKQLGDLYTTIATFDTPPFNGKNLFESVEGLINKFQDSEQYQPKGDIRVGPIQIDMFNVADKLIRDLDNKNLELQTKIRQIIEWEVATTEVSIFYLHELRKIKAQYEELETRNQALINEIQLRDKIISKRSHQYEMIGYQYQELRQHNVKIELDLIHANSENMKLRDELTAIRHIKNK